MDARVLVAHQNAEYVARLLALCRDRGIEIVGPVGTAGLALALAALGPLTLALVSRSLPDERDGANLAGALRARWGVPARVIDAPDPGELLRELRL